jgi:hypothetical protein
MPRWKVACDVCDASAWIGDAPGGFDAWCEACQSGAATGPDPSAAKCGRCGRALSCGEPRFIEIFGELQNLTAVLAAWQGDRAPLAALLPERPRFLSDRNPPASQPGDPAALHEGLEALRRGDFAGAARRLAEPEPGEGEPRRLRALAIALERCGDAERAERVLDGIRGAGETQALLLERGALHARRGDLAGARQDFMRAGDGYEARWNRGALGVHQAVGESGAPDPVHLAAARRAAGAPSGAWSDHTVGRLLWTLLIESAARRGVFEPEVLRAAEAEFEFDSFWDRAAMIEGYARLGAAAEVVRLASPLALELAEALVSQPAIAGDVELSAALAEARAAIGERRVPDALATMARLLGRGDLARYRVPCRACSRGSVGVAEFLEDAAAEPDEAESHASARRP